MPRHDTILFMGFACWTGCCRCQNCNLRSNCITPSLPTMNMIQIQSLRNQDDFQPLSHSSSTRVEGTKRDFDPPEYEVTVADLSNRVVIYKRCTCSVEYNKLIVFFHPPAWAGQRFKVYGQINHKTEKIEPLDDILITGQLLKPIDGNSQSVEISLMIYASKPT